MELICEGDEHSFHPVALAKIRQGYKLVSYTFIFLFYFSIITVIYFFSPKLGLLTIHGYENHNLKHHLNGGIIIHIINQHSKLGHKMKKGNIEGMSGEKTPKSFHLLAEERDRKDR